VEVSLQCRSDGDWTAAAQGKQSGSTNSLFLANQHSAMAIYDSSTVATCSSSQYTDDCLPLQPLPATACHSSPLYACTRLVRGPTTGYVPRMTVMSRILGSFLGPTEQRRLPACRKMQFRSSRYGTNIGEGTNY